MCRSERRFEGGGIFFSRFVLLRLKPADFERFNFYEFFDSFFLFCFKMFAYVSRLTDLSFLSWLFIQEDSKRKPLGLLRSSDKPTLISRRIFILMSCAQRTFVSDSKIRLLFVRILDTSSKGLIQKKTLYFCIQLLSDRIARFFYNFFPKRDN